MCSSTFSFPVHLAWARRRSPTSWPTPWVWGLSARAARWWRRRATWPDCSPTVERGDILFIDEIHRLQATIEEYLYPAMEDFKLDIIIDGGPNARSVRLNLPRFTLIGATTPRACSAHRCARVSGWIARLGYYDAGDLQHIVLRSAGLLGLVIDAGGALRDCAPRPRYFRALRTIICAGSAISPRCAPTDGSPGRWLMPRWPCATSMPKARRDGQARARGAGVQVCRRSGGLAQSRRRGGGRSRDPRRGARAVPHHARLREAHSAGSGGAGQDPTRNSA